MSRLPWDIYFLHLANQVALRGTCPRRMVGAVFVGTDNEVLSTGYNGAPRGVQHCKHEQVPVIPCTAVPNHVNMDGATEIAPTQYRTTGTDKNGNCITAVHAELNAIHNAARLGIPLRGSTAYITVAPCRACFYALIQCGVQRVVYMETNPYYDFTTAPELPPTLSFAVYPLEQVMELASIAQLAMFTANGGYKNTGGGA